MQKRYDIVQRDGHKIVNDAGVVVTWPNIGQFPNLPDFGDKCPKCGEEENLHANIDWASKDLHTTEIVCNECKTRFVPRVPIAVVVEVEDVGGEEWMGDDENGQPFWNEVIVPVVIGNEVIVKQWIYE